MRQRGASPPQNIPETYGFGWQDLQLHLDLADEVSLLNLCDFAVAQGTRADRVSGILGQSYSVSDQQFDPDRLSLVDRVAALFHLAFKFGNWPARFICACSQCQSGNEVRVAPEEFDYKPARSYAVDLAQTRMMQPNGYHERLLENGARVTSKTLALSGEPQDETGFEALSDAAPEFKTALDYTCSNCAAISQFWFDPLAWIADHVQVILTEVHQLASAYGWSEAQILALPRARRQSYILLIQQGQER